MNPEIEKYSNDLSKERTGLSQHRTELSEYRTELSEHRSDLSVARSHLANERTHLSYLRTAISLISFGVTMNRFSLFMIENESMSRFGGRTFLHDSKNVGIGMVALGCTMLIWSAIRYMNTFKSIEALTYKPSRGSVLTFTLAIILIGIVSIVWLMKN